jgi:hypothetical protein
LKLRLDGRRLPLCVLDLQVELVRLAVRDH